MNLKYTPIIKNKEYLFFILPIIYLLFVQLFFSFDGLYGQDAYEYLRYSRAISDFLKSGEHPGNYFWAIYYPFFGALLNIVIDNSIISLQLISIISLSLSGLYTYKIIKIIYDKNEYALLFTLVFYSISPFIIKAGLSSMSDMLALLFIQLTVYHCFLYKIKLKFSSLLYASIFTIIAIFVRYPSGVILFPIIIWTVITFIKQKNYWQIFLLIPIIILFAAPQYYFKSQNSTLEFLSHEWISYWSIKNLFLNEFSTDSGFYSYNSINLAYAFSNLFYPGYLFIGIVFFALYIFKKNKFLIFEKILWISFILYGLFLAGIPYQNKRYLLLSFPIIIILFYKNVNTFDIVKYKKWLPIIISLIVVIQLGLTTFSLKSIITRNQLEREIVSIIGKYENNKLYSFDMDISLKGRKLNFEYKNLWVEEYSSFDKGALVLFNPELFKTQWEGKNPMINWNKLQKNYNLKVLEQCPNGWVLFQIKQ